MRILILMLSFLFCLSSLPADVGDVSGQKEDSLNFVLTLSDSIDVGFSSEPVESWSAEPVKLEDETLAVIPDDLTSVYVYWKINSLSTFDITLSGEPMQSANETINWKAEWENHGEKTELGYSDEYAPKTIASFAESGFKADAGSEKVDILLESTDAVPGYYTGSITLEVNNR